MSRLGVSPIVLVGESNPYSTRRYDALLPWPRGASGDRLRVILELDDVLYLALFPNRYNLVRRVRRRGWSMEEARAKAALIQKWHPDRPIICLGRRVASVFQVEEDCAIVERGGNQVVAFPHPSGRCRRWHDPAVVEAVRACFRELRAWQSNQPTGEVKPWQESEAVKHRPRPARAATAATGRR
jgi:hypothetical protein